MERRTCVIFFLRGDILFRKLRVVILGYFLVDRFEACFAINPLIVSFAVFTRNRLSWSFGRLKNLRPVEVKRGDDL